MSEGKKYFGEHAKFGGIVKGVIFELRADIAMRLIERFGSVAGKTDGEDTAGRARLTLQEPEELVKRCYAIADLFVAEAERRGDISEFDHRTELDKSRQEKSA